MKIFCVARNYVAHAKELNNKVPTEPVIFMKPPTALLLNDRPFYHPTFSDNIHYEGELVLKISKNGKCIEEEFAHKYFEEATVGIDFTARDLQAKCKEKGWPWEIAKAFDKSAAVGKFVPVDSKKINEQVFSLHKNGEQVQQTTPGEMIFQIPKLLNHISQFFKVQQGDLVFTGTPVGVGQIHDGELYEGYVGNQKVLQTQIKRAPEV